MKKFKFRNLNEFCLMCVNAIGKHRIQITYHLRGMFYFPNLKLCRKLLTSSFFTLTLPFDCKSVLLLVRVHSLFCKVFTEYCIYDPFQLKSIYRNVNLTSSETAFGAVNVRLIAPRE